MLRFFFLSKDSHLHHASICKPLTPTKQAATFRDHHEVDTLDEAIAIENANPYGNAAAIYTMSGQTALETEP